MFICLKCNAGFQLPKCDSCGNIVEKENNIWQLSNDPDIAIDGDRDKYIGYEYIGDSYSGSRKYVIEEKDYKFSKEIARLTGDGVFLDLACGDGCITVPVASFGTRIIAADISNSMLRILINRAHSNNIDLLNTTLCRINALNIPIIDNSISCVVANGVLHLISNPEKVIQEIHRILKPNGAFVCIDDTPGKEPTTDFDNSKYNEIVNNMYSQYWAYMKDYNIFPIRYSWRFDRNSVCGNIFNSKETLLLKHNKKYSIMMKDGFLPRFFNKGFSDQVEVPKDIHNKVIEQLNTEFKQRYGEDYDTISFVGIEPDVLITKYYK